MSQTPSPIPRQEVRVACAMCDVTFTETIENCSPGAASMVAYNRYLEHHAAEHADTWEKLTRDVMRELRRIGGKFCGPSEGATCVVCENRKKFEERARLLMEAGK